MSYLAGAALVAVGGIVGGAAAAYLNCFSSTKQVCVGSLEDFAVGRMKEVTVPGMDQQIIIIRESQTRFRACGSMCTHARIKLVQGVLGCETSRLVCPSHGACFNTETGDIEDGYVLQNDYGLLILFMRHTRLDACTPNCAFHFYARTPAHTITPRPTHYFLQPCAQQNPSVSHQRKGRQGVRRDPQACHGRRPNQWRGAPHVQGPAF